MHKTVLTAMTAALLVVAAFRPAAAQQTERLTFDEAVRRAVTSNPTVQRAAVGIMRAESLMAQVAASSRPSLDATFATNVIDPVTQFGGNSINPRAQTSTQAGLSAPLVTPVRWAQRAQAADQVFVAQQTAVDVRRQIAVATAQAYLAIITSRRVLELNERARDSAQAHYDYANQRFQGGIGSRLNAIRAQQEVLSDEERVEEARLAVRRSQEALGVLVAADAPVDAAAEPVFEVPPADATPASAAAAAAPTPGPAPGFLLQRADINVLAARQSAAEHTLRDSWRDRLPSVTALFTPQVLAPSGLFAQPRSWRGTVLFTVPLFDSGFRLGQKNERQALVDLVKLERTNAERQASSEVRTAREAIASTERSLDRAQQAANQANEVMRITDVAFREGATTNIEVLDAQRRARDAETQAAIAEDALRHARLELLVALGRFPQ